MDTYKIDNFKRENPNGRIDYLELNQEDSNWMLNQMLQKLLISPQSISNTESLFKALDTKLFDEILYSDEIDVDLLENYFNSIQVPNDSILGVIWDFESKVDVFTTKNLLKYWEDIWYDSSDEAILIFIPSRDKVLLLTDHGNIKTN